MIYWFGTALIILSAYLIFTKNFNIKIRKNLILPILIFGALSFITTFLLMTSARTVGASLTSFVMQTTIIFTLIYSVFLLKEKTTKKEILGIILVLIGLLILNYNTDIKISISSLIVIIAAFTQSTNYFLVKKLIKDISKMQINFIRVLSLFIFALVYLLLTNQTFQPITLNNYLILVLGVLLGPIITYVFFYSALEKTSLANANTLKSISPIFTLILALIFLRETPDIQNIISFVTIVIGSFFILFKK